MNTKKTNVVKASTAEEIEKAIAEHERQIEVYKQKLIETRKRETDTKLKETIFTYLDSVRKNPLDNA
jgi:N-dimethylarginine dimethylaminohydrolase